MNKIIKIYFLLFLFLLLAGCSTQDQSDQSKEPADNNDENTQEVQGKEKNPQDEIVEEEEKDDQLSIEVANRPQTIEELIEYPIGEYGNSVISINDENVKKTLADMPDLSENEEAIDEVLNYLYSLYKMPYQDPKELIENSVLKSPGAAEEVATKEQYNVEIVLDASGSMANYMGAKTRMELAKESIQAFASTLPDEVNLSLRVYGHEGTGSDADKKMSCAANELVYESQSYNESELSNALNSFEPAGWTPLAASILEAKDDLSNLSAENNINVVYIVSDGIETCDGDPVAAAKELKDSGISPVVNVIGFDLAKDDEQQLKDIASAAEGNYLNVKNQNQLDNEFNKTVKESQKWLEWSSSEKFDALVQSSQERMELMKVQSEWFFSMANEEKMITQSISELENQKKLTKNQADQMQSNIKEFYEKHYASVKELNNTLTDLSKENLDEKIKEIENLYEKNVPN
ncbi:VWA domain-containing protein [Cytobacillus sp. FSL R5-0569]|uniref:VWA domain-containing protein n=1 Tax=Cytobacillus sp. FSL R5-0569 TaxID=2921649 RepID=UPI0030F9FDD3